MSTDRARTTDRVKADVVTGETAGKPSKTQLRSDAMRARADLARTLDAIEYKLNLPKQLRNRALLLKRRLHRLGEDTPTALAAIAVAGGLVAGAVVWLGAKAVQNH
jgi:hypothetical protein